VLTALVASGLPAARFAFEGFLPRTKSSRRSKLAALAAVETRTMVFYEAANRTSATLAEMAEAFSEDRRCCVGRELTKRHEQFLRGPLKHVIEQFKAADQRGEVTIVVAGLPQAEDGDTEPEAVCAEELLTSALRAALSAGASERDAVKLVSAELKLSKRDVYAVMLSMKGEE
jgi:16S rRNA (cytidine1402-2'-O)-methyltransferase